MKNISWYYLCNLRLKVATDMMRLPETWGGICSLHELNDESLADLSWANLPEEGFLSEAAATSLGVSIESLERVREFGVAESLTDLRAQRNARLAISDALVTPDRWDTYPTQKKAAISAYRKELRDFPASVDPFNPTWPEQAVVEVVTIAPVSRRQAKLALLEAGLLAQVEQTIAGMPGDSGVAARVEWADASTFERGSYLINEMGAALELTDLQVDALFQLAATL